MIAFGWVGLRWIASWFIGWLVDWLIGYPCPRSPELGLSEGNMCWGKWGVWLGWVGSGRIGLEVGSLIGWMNTLALDLLRWDQARGGSPIESLQDGLGWVGGSGWVRGVGGVDGSWGGWVWRGGRRCVCEKL